jgi:tetratricopeptide (TPR) repeat protein
MMLNDFDVELAETLKSEGTDLVKAKKWAEALTKYEHAIGCLHEAGCIEEDDGAPAWLFGKAGRPETKLMLLACRLNSALCALTIDEFEVCVEHCSAALKMKRDQPKALFRRGRAYLELKKFDLAKRDLLSCQRIALANKDIIRTSWQRRPEVHPMRFNQRSAAARGSAAGCLSVR